MKVLALDLATHTGYAYDDVLGQLQCGTWLLATDKELKAASRQRMNRRCDIRISKLFHLIRNLNRDTHFDVIVFEDVQFSTYTLQCQLWSSLRAAMWLAPFYNPIFEAVPVGTLKRFATGNGWATKEAMCAALVKTDSNFRAAEKPDTVYQKPDKLIVYQKPDKLIDDNGVDAIWLHKWAKKNLSRIKI